MTGPHAGSRGLDVAVVIATYRRPDLLARCLDALCTQSVDGSRYEIVVAADDAGQPGADATRETVAQRCVSTGGMPALRYVPVTRTQGPAGARNAGWQATDALVIAFTDDDTIPDPHWLERGLASLAGGLDAVGGAIVMPMPASPPTDYERDASGLARAEFATANCFVRRRALETVGGFDERFTSAWREDSDLQFELIMAGFRVGRAMDAIVVHPIRPAPFGVSIGQQRKVLFDVLLFKKHRRLYRTRILPSPPWNYYVNVAALIAVLAGTVAASRPVAVVGLALWVASTSSFAYRRLRDTSRRPSHVAEMLWTSIVIPPLALWWRLVGVVRYRTVYF